MAKIDDLTRQVSDPKLRRELEAAVAELKKRTKFGLVYENHMPEMTALPGLPVTEGATVVRRDKLSARHAFQVSTLADGLATLLPSSIDAIPGQFVVAVIGHRHVNCRL